MKQEFFACSEVAALCIPVGVGRIDNREVTESIRCHGMCVGTDSCSNTHSEIRRSRPRSGILPCIECPDIR